MTALTRSEVAVIGGGLVGVSAALGLAALGFRVTLIERRQPVIQKGRLGVDLRNVAISPASQALLGRLGIWDHVESAAYSHMSIWEEWGAAQLGFDAADVGRSELGWLVEMSPLVCAGWQQAEQVRRIDGVDRAGDIDIVLGNIEALSVTQDNVDITMLGGEHFRFDFLIAADGAQSMVRKTLQLPLLQETMDQVAIATVVRTQRTHQNTAWQRFLVDGPLAFLPTWDDHLCSVVWSQSRTQAERRMQLSDSVFCGEIERALEARLGDILSVDQRMMLPLAQQRLENCAPVSRVLLIGDAQRVIHPLAGQGVNLGLEDVAGIMQLAASHRDLSAPGLWTRYARERQTRSKLMIQSLTLLRRIYANDAPAMSWLRNAGVGFFNQFDGLKHQVMREAMGLGRLN